jgi:hypothetical protein
MTRTSNIYIILISAILVLSSSCTENSGRSEQSGEKTVTKSVPATSSSYPEINTWADDLRNFRTAVLKNDVEKLSTYFDFPLINDTTQIWSAVYENVEEDKRPKEFKATFEVSDFKEHYKSLFNEPFSKTLKAVKLQDLYKTNQFTTPEIKSEPSSYHMLASFNQSTSIVELSVIFSGEMDENGAEISETEHAIIYFFSVKGNRLKFDKILFAG